MEPTPDLLQEVFNRTTITEVIFEVRFDSILRINRDISFLQDAIKDEFPVYLEDKLVEEDAHAFQTADGTCKIRVTPSRYNFTTNNYTSFSEFKSLILPSLSKLIEIFNIKEVKRTGLRYINQIPFEKEKGITEIFNNFIDIPVESARYEGINIDGFKLELFMNSNETQILSRHGLFEIKEKEAPFRFVYIVDIDCFSENIMEANIDTISALTDELHSQEKKEFIKSIQPGYVEWMRGGVKEC